MARRLLDARAEQVEFHRDAEAARFANRVTNPFLRRKETVLARLVAEYVPPGAARVLEVGCGEGSNLWFLDRERPGCRMVGIDLSPAKVRFLRERQPAVTVAAGDALRLPLADGQFDTVLCRDLLHHVNWDRDGVIAECLRVLRPGGTLVLLEGSGRTMLNRLFGALYPVERGMRNSTPDAIDALLRRHGRPQLRFVEPSSMVRAVGFVLGWPTGVARVLASPVYVAAAGWERLMAAMLPRRRWVYIVGVICRG